MRYCPCCGKVFSEVGLVENPKENGTWICPTYNCYGTVFEIDEHMIPLIRWLTINGFQTMFCCSGHVYESHICMYISMVCPETFIKLYDADKLDDHIKKYFHGEYKIHDRRDPDNDPFDATMYKITSDGLNSRRDVEISFYAPKDPFWKYKNLFQKQEWLFSTLMTFNRELYTLFSNAFDIVFDAKSSIKSRAKKK